MVRIDTRRIAVLAVTVVVTACASSGSGSSGARSSPDRIERAEITKSNASNAYELINRLRPNWLRATNPGSIGGGVTRTQMILVYLDGQRLEDMNALKTISAASIQSGQWIDSARAATVLRDVPTGPIAGAILLKTQ